jgi:hypothetical protein
MNEDEKVVSNGVTTQKQKGPIAGSRVAAVHCTLYDPVEGLPPDFLEKWAAYFLLIVRKSPTV